jgi:starch phosphorylase
LSQQNPIAYFSAEFGVHHSLPIYSGGLGILAGDHLKSASDLGRAAGRVGLFYRFGYMSQQLSSDGQQVAADKENRPRSSRSRWCAPPTGGRSRSRCRCQAANCTCARGRRWSAACRSTCSMRIARRTAPRTATSRATSTAATETRIQQEIVLGRGGVRLLRAMGLRPAVYHMNEGHAAFLTLERTSRLVRGEGLPFEAAREYVAQTTLFTTHTPVPAGHDRFGEDLVRRYFGDAEEWVGLPWDRFFALGQASGGTNEFNMTYLAMNFAGFVNGVSKLHGLASQKLLHAFWPGLLQSEVPVGSITNGMHLATWTQNGIARLLRGDDGQCGRRTSCRPRRSMPPNSGACIRPTRHDARCRARRADANVPRPR